MNNVNALKVYFGDPYPITDRIVLYQPTVNDVIENELGFWYAVNSLTATSTFYRLQLWDNGIDWTKVSNYQMFCYCVSKMPVEISSMFFKDQLVFSNFQLLKIEGVEPDQLQLPPDQKKPTAADKRNLKFHNFEKMYTFYDKDHDIQINASSFHMISNIVSEMMHIYHKNEYAVGKISKELIIEGDRNLRLRDEMQAKKSRAASSTMQPLISMCVNHPGFKYNIAQTRNLPIAQFMDCAKRLQVYESTHALFIGANSGFIDTSKISRESFDFTRSINK